MSRTVSLVLGVQAPRVATLHESPECPALKLRIMVDRNMHYGSCQRVRRSRPAGGEPSPVLQPCSEWERRGGPERLRRAPPFHAALGAHPRLGEGFGHRTQAHQYAGRDRRGEAFVPGSVLEAPVSRFGRRVQRVEAGGLSRRALAHRLARRGGDGVRRVLETLAGAQGCGASRLVRRTRARAMPSRPSPSSPPRRTRRYVRYNTGCRYFCRRRRSSPGTRERASGSDRAPKDLLAMHWIGQCVKNARDDEPECVVASAAA